MKISLDSMKMIIKEEFHSSVVPGYSTGMIEIRDYTYPTGINTLDIAKAFLRQVAKTRTTETQAVYRSVKDDGFNPIMPIKLNAHYLTDDGWTRLSQAIQVVEDGFSEVEYVSFCRYTKPTDSEIFNGGARGASVEMLHAYFGDATTKTDRDRAAHEAIVASKLLKVRELGFDEAFNPHCGQTHIQFLTGVSSKLTKAYDGVREVCKNNSWKPNDCCFAHWLALFIRHGVTDYSTTVAGKHYLPRNSTQPERSAVFEKMSNILTRGDV